MRGGQGRRPPRAPSTLGAPKWAPDHKFTVIFRCDEFLELDCLSATQCSENRHYFISSSESYMQLALAVRDGRITAIFFITNEYILDCKNLKCV